MSFAPSVLQGRQEPRLSSVPPYDSSDGDLAIEYAASVNLHLDPWQQHVMTEALGRRGGTWAAFEVDVTVGRQNGKGAILEARELAGIEVFGNKLIIHTAHELKTAEEARLRMEQICEASQDLDRRVKRVVRTNGKEAIEFWNERRTSVGARIKYAARSKGSGRGFAGADLVVMDEKMFLRAEPMAALLPTLATSPDPQVWYTGSAFFEESDQQKSLRERMLAGLDPELAAFEWSVDDDADLDDRQAWAISNPALGYRMTERFLERERAALTAADFAREHLGIGGAGKSAAVIDADAWASLTDRRSQVEPAAFAVDVNPERTHTAIGVCGWRDDGLPHVEVVQHDPGTQWATDRLIELSSKYGCRVLLDPTSPAGSLILPLTKADVDVVLVSGREMAQACGDFYDYATPGDPAAQGLRHISQPLLNMAVDAGRKRTVGDAWAWHRRDAGADISPLVAVTLALHGASLPPPDEPEPEPEYAEIYY